MKSRLAAAIFNSGLLVVVLLLLAAPLLTGQLLSTYESGALGAATTGNELPAGVSQGGSTVFAVYPNVSDFTQYAQFNENPITEAKTYQTDVTFTAFSGQQAAYNALFTVYNTGANEIRLKVEGGKLSSGLTSSRIWLSAVVDGQSASTLVTQSAAVGDKLLKVAQLPDFDQSKLVVGNDVVEAKRESGTTATLSKGLGRKVGVGEKVFVGPIFYNGAATPVITTTETIILKPQQKAVLSLAVATDAGGTPTSQAVLPLVISAE